MHAASYSRSSLCVPADAAEVICSYVSLYLVVSV